MCSRSLRVRHRRMCTAGRRRHRRSSDGTCRAALQSKSSVAAKLIGASPTRETGLKAAVADQDL